MDEFFRKFAAKTSMVVGSPWAFLCAVLIIVVWAPRGPGLRLLGHLATGHQHGHDHHHLPDGLPHPEHAEPRRQAIHLKLDELIKATRGARNHMMDLDKLSDKQLRELEEEYKRICAADDEQGNGNGSPGHQAVKEEIEERESAGGKRA